jgi:16S rRNA (guanine(1405)-N(7))-methyltransferase
MHVVLQEPGSEAVGEVVAELRRSRRYRSLAEPTLRRVAERSLDVEQGRVQPAVKRSKRALHEIFGAYVGRTPRYARLEANLAAGVETGDSERVRAAARQALAAHASTAERLEVLDEFYDRVFEATGSPESVVDVACGLNPLATPWMRLDPEARYTALDIDADSIAFVDRALELLGVEHVAHVADVLFEPPPEGDVVLLLKTIPCLEQQESGAGYRLVDALRARAVVASFPTASLGGRAKGMARTYAQRFEREAAERGWRFEQLAFSGELVYVVRK